MRCPLPTPFPQTTMQTMIANLRRRWVAMEAMREIGVDLTQEFPKPLTDEFVRAADAVITIGCGDACPIYPGMKYEDWKLDAPAVRAFRQSGGSVMTSSDESGSYLSHRANRFPAKWVYLPGSR